MIVTQGNDIPTGAVPLKAAGYQFEIVDNSVVITDKAGNGVVTLRLFESTVEAG